MFDFFSDALLTPYESTSSLIGVTLHESASDDLSPPLLVAVTLTFADSAATIEAVAEDDTINVTDGGPTDRELQPRSVEGRLAWSRIIGRRIVWMWRLTNQQGYDDGLQFEFGPADDDASPVVQFVAIGSGLQIRWFKAAPDSATR